MSKNNRTIIGGRYQYNPNQIFRTTSTFQQYRAIDKALNNRQLNLQILNKQQTILEKLRDIKHPFITAIIDLVTLQDGRVAFLGQLGAVANLAEVLKGVNYIQQDDALVIFKYMLIAVKEIHSKLITINTLCPQNFIFSNPSLIKLGYNIFDSNLAMEYKAPQVLQNQKSTYQSDIYSLGVILYKMLYGYQPFEGDNQDILANNIKKKNFKENNLSSPLKTVISRQVHYLLLSMLDYYPDNRPTIQSMLSASYMDVHIETDPVLIVKPKKNTSIIPQSFYKKYMVFRPTKITNNYGYYQQSSYMVLAIKQKILMTLYCPEYKMYQTQPRKVQSYYQKLKAMQENYVQHGTQFLCRIDGTDRFKQQPVLVTEYCNQGNLYDYLQKRKIFQGWLSPKQVNIIMYIVAMSLKQLKEIGITSLHTLSDKRIMISNHNLKLRQPGLISSSIQKQIVASDNIDYYAPQLKQPYQFVEYDKTDLWSYGVLYYYLLVGKLPALNNENLIQLQHLKTSQKNRNLIGKCLDQTVSKRLTLENIKIQDLDENTLQAMLHEQQQNQIQNLSQSQSQIGIDRRKVIFKNRKVKLFKYYNKIISQSQTSSCRIWCKIIFGLLSYLIVFFGLFFINGGIGLIKSNYYRPTTLQVPYNYGTSIYNLTILTTDGQNIKKNYVDYSYQKFINQLKCVDNNYTNIANSTKTVSDFANGTQSVLCLFGFIFIILFCILYGVIQYKFDLPKLLVKRAQKNSNKDLYHWIVLLFLLPSLMFCFFYIFAIEYIIQMKPCFGVQNLDYPKFTSIDALFSGDLSKYFVNVFLTVILWSILMFLYGYLSIFVVKINNYIYQWALIIPVVLIMLIYFTICRIGFGTTVPIEPTYSYKINLNIIFTFYGFFGFFPQVFCIVLFGIDRLVDFIFWVFLRLGFSPNQEQDINNVGFLRINAQPTLNNNNLQVKNQANINMIEHKWDLDY